MDSLVIASLFIQVFNVGAGRVEWLLSVPTPIYAYFYIY